MKLGVAVFLAILHVACNPNTQSNLHTADAYRSEQMLCVDKAKNNAEANACRCDVQKRYGRTCTEVKP